MNPHLMQMRREHDNALAQAGTSGQADAAVLRAFARGIEKAVEIMYPGAGPKWGVPRG